jgi:hypothetical protein
MWLFSQTVGNICQVLPFHDIGTASVSGCHNYFTTLRWQPAIVVHRIKILSEQLAMQCFKLSRL